MEEAARVVAWPHFEQRRRLLAAHWHHRAATGGEAAAAREGVRGWHAARNRTEALLVSIERGYGLHQALRIRMRRPVEQLEESIVGGTVTPDTFIVRKSDLAITNRTIADKQHMTVSTSGGTHEVEVPRFLRNETSLNDEQVIEMAKLALTLEITMEHPVDIECAYAGGELYLLQCRPITTLR
jgi:hypothetical protein